MKDVARRAFLLDFYGSLLTEKQRDIYEWYYQQDLSLGEIGEVAGVSRNAVYDLISRTDEKLERYEKALGLIAAGQKRDELRDGLAEGFEGWLGTKGAGLAAEAKAELGTLIRRLREL